MFTVYIILSLNCTLQNCISLFKICKNDFKNLRVKNDLLLYIITIRFVYLFIFQTYQKELDKKHKLIKSRDSLKNYLSSLETILFTHMAVCSFFPNRQGQQQQPPHDTHHSRHQDLPQLSMVLGGESFQPCNVSGLQQQHAVLSSANGPPLTSLNSQSNRAQAVTVNSRETPATNFFSFTQSCADQEQTENSCPDADPIAAPLDSNNVTNLGHQDFILSSTDMVAAISELVEDWNSGVILDENHSPDAHYTALYSQPTPMVASSWALEGEGGQPQTFGHSNNGTGASPHARHSGFEPEIQNISASSSEAPRNAVTLEISKGDDQLLEKRDYGDIYPLISAANSRDNVLFRRSKSPTRSDYNGLTRSHSNPGMNSLCSILSHQPVNTLSESRSRHVVPGSVEGTPPESPGTGVADEVMLIESETECSLSIPELPSENEPCLSFSDFLDCLRQKQI